MDLLFRKKKKTTIVFAVLLTKQNWEIGEQISGKILFRKNQTVKHNGIKARFVGRETFTQASRDKDKIVFDTECVSVAEKGKTIEGDTVLPFTFTIPEGLPPSVNIPGVGIIKYEVTARLLLKTGDITSDIEVYIHKPTPSSLPLTYNDKKDWGLLSKESLLLRCIPDKIMYLPGNTMELEMTIDNRTKKDVSRILVGIERTIKCGKQKDSTSITQIEIPRGVLPVDPSTK